MPTTKERLEYYVPPLGTVRTTLHDESADVYRYLRRVGEVERLNRLDHLGIIRNAIPGAHHPRWEYVNSILRVIDACEQSHELHTSTTVDLTAGVKLSSAAELLRVWALIMNVGHLHWTFMAERCLVMEI